MTNVNEFVVCRDIKCDPGLEHECQCLSPTPSQTSRKKSPHVVPIHFYSNLNGRRSQEFPVRPQCPAGSTELTIQSSLLFIFTQKDVDVWPTETQRHIFTTICKQTTNVASLLHPVKILGLHQGLQQVTKTQSDRQNDDAVNQKRN